MNDIGASVDDTLGNYISENYNNILKIESTEDLRGKNDNGLDQLVPVTAVPVGSWLQGMNLIPRYSSCGSNLLRLVYRSTDKLRFFG